MLSKYINYQASKKSHLCHIIEWTIFNEQSKVERTLRCKLLASVW